MMGRLWQIERECCHLASGPGWIPSPRTKLDPTLPTTADARGSPSRSRIRYTASMPVQCAPTRDRKSTRLNSSHLGISYAVFCLKKKTKRPTHNAPSHWQSARLYYSPFALLH